MKAIRTRYLPATICSPAKYAATDGDGNRISVTVSEIEQELGDGNWTPDGHHRLAAKKLCEKMGWKGEFVTGYYAGANAFFHVFLSPEQAAATELLDALRETLRTLVRVEGFPDKGKGRTEKQQAVFDQAKAAIRKATGVTHV